MQPAVFLDRDGVINPNVFNSLTGQWESPHRENDFQLFPWTIGALQDLQKNQFKLFLISNQPSYAKGKASLVEIKTIQEKFHSFLIENKVSFTEYFYCYHHPEGIIPELSLRCSCRKPGIAFIKEAEKEYSLDLQLSWIVGDRDSDIACGKKARLKTILVLNPEESLIKKQGESVPDFKAADLREAVKIIINETKKRRKYGINQKSSN